ncbi:DUF3667 domain-containing protein [Chryseobacterium sp. GMJ5]|uniref:DUF3667 domain-containing protein n=1 Tax=Chryseobacterium gilvum TaxID=2976534 RepID=A0ABT2VZK9_9FLAO|nr:DUF3667 domain-containing protein [Chryseobacterium gilvum]MCU7615366.1 DUF3667 domain-containing protein [Chryseobacterium gilvum]
MSHGKIRDDKTCLNCSHIVEERFCPYCGQENTESRQPFYFLFTHFIEDFTHYDGQFWKTLQYLLFKPGKLTKQYLSGKRQVFVAPVKLYIFISFITFLLPGLLPESKKEAPAFKTQTNLNLEKENTKKTLEKMQQTGILSKATSDKIKKKMDSKDYVKITDSTGNAMTNESKIIRETFSDKSRTIMGADSMKEYDSIKKTDKSGTYTVFRPLAEKMFEMKANGLSKKQMVNKYFETLIHTIPKALFIYLPVFAFFLWIFHNKKKWWYFDHGIFTLHYFSFLLLTILILIVVKKIFAWLPDYLLFNFLSGLITLVIIVYMSVYFFIAHYRVYESSKRMSIFKGSVLFIVNCIGLSCMLMILAYISFVMLH